MNIIWTTEQILGLAPDPYSLKTSRSFAFTERWAKLGHNYHTAWGEFPVKDKSAFQTAVQLSILATSCSCISRKLPCSHSLSLLLLLAEQPEAFSEMLPPEWVATWQNQYQGHKHPLSATQRSVQENCDQKRLKNIRAGLEELELWLQDLVRTGFATAQGKPKSYWLEMAERLVDAQAGEVAREVRLLATLPGSDEAWPERLLQKIGRLYLLIQGFTRFEALPTEMQADLQMAVGWLPHLNTLDAAPVRDKWHILGRQLDQSGKQKVQRIWLWGEQYNQPALLISIAYSGHPLDTSLVPGTLLEADLGFYPSAAPLRAHLITRSDIGQPRQRNLGYPTIKTARQAYAQAITANPWLPYFPIALHAVTAEPFQKEWIVRDQTGYLLPLPPHYEYGWHLRALGRDGQLSLFGVWDGQYLHPLSLWHADWWGELHTWGGVK